MRGMRFQFSLKRFLVSITLIATSIGIVASMLNPNFQGEGKVRLAGGVVSGCFVGTGIAILFKQHTIAGIVIGAFVGFIFMVAVLAAPLNGI
jgi:hypothetical protein